ncbi:hypothetical protein Aduo_000023 [Ancylostoma duodenale]
MVRHQSGAIGDGTWNMGGSEQFGVRVSSSDISDQQIRGDERVYVICGRYKEAPLSSGGGNIAWTTTFAQYDDAFLWCGTRAGSYCHLRRQS